MLPPRRHFISDYLLIIKGLFQLPNPRAFLLLLYLVLFTSYPVLHAQVQTINDPNVKATITNEKVASLGKSGKVTDLHPVRLNFEGLGNLDEVMQYYGGGTSKEGFKGVNCNISFSPGAMAIIDQENGGTGNFSRDPSPNTVLFSNSKGQIIINVNKGFNSALSFLYTSSDAVAVTLYDSTDGKGNLIFTKLLLPVYDAAAQKAGISYDKWILFREVFTGKAKSVVLNGTPNKCAFDDIIFGEEKGAGGGITSTSTGAGNSGKLRNYLLTPQAPTEKGNVFLTGASRLGISVGGEKSKSGGSTVDGSESTYYDIDFLPKGGYYFLNNFVGGLFIDLELYNNKTKSSGNAYKGVTFIAGPFVRYYVPVNDKIMPFIEGQIGGGIDHYSTRSSSSDDWSKTNENVFTYRAGAGATYFINEIVGFDAFIGFLHDSYKYKDSGDGSQSSDSKSVYNEFNLQLGIVVVL